MNSSAARTGCQPAIARSESGASALATTSRVAHLASSTGWKAMPACGTRSQRCAPPAESPTSSVASSSSTEKPQSGSAARRQSASGTRIATAAIPTASTATHRWRTKWGGSARPIASGAVVL